MVVLRLRSRRPACCRNVQPDRHRQDERHRPAGLAGRHAGQDRDASGPPTRRIAAVELDAGGYRRGGLSLTQVNKVYHVHTIARVAAMLGEEPLAVVWMNS